MAVRGGTVGAVAVAAFLMGAFGGQALRGIVGIPAAPAPAADDGTVRVYFSPDRGCAAAVVEQIAAATRTLDVAAYAITHPDVAGAIAKAKRRGVRVRVILDASQATQDYSSATYLDNAGIDVRTWRGGGSMHHKAILIDGKTLVCGSFNYTKAADTQNAENLLVIRNRPAVLAAFAEEFSTLLERSKRYERKR